MPNADRWLVGTEAEIQRGDWIDPDAGWITLGEYAKRWVTERDLKTRTREEYERLIRLHVGRTWATRRSRQSPAR